MAGSVKQNPFKYYKRSSLWALEQVLLPDIKTHETHLQVILTQCFMHVSLVQPGRSPVIRLVIVPCFTAVFAARILLHPACVFTGKFAALLVMEAEDIITVMQYNVQECFSPTQVKTSSLCVSLCVCTCECVLSCGGTVVCCENTTQPGRMCWCSSHSRSDGPSPNLRRPPELRGEIFCAFPFCQAATWESGQCQTITLWTHMLKQQQCNF